MCDAIKGHLFYIDDDVATKCPFLPGGFRVGGVLGSALGARSTPATQSPNFSNPGGGPYRANGHLCLGDARQGHFRIPNRNPNPALNVQVADRTASTVTFAWESLVRASPTPQP